MVNDTVSARRRRLIRASAAAVPVIMTLRSGAALAVTSLHACIERDAKRAAVELGPEDQVFGDDPGETPHDEWARVGGKAGKKVTFTSGQSGNQSIWYCIRNADSTAPWDDIQGWDCYDESGVLANNTTIQSTAWAAATNFYCVNKAGIWECVDEGGGPVTPTIPAAGIDAGKDVLLLVYVTSYDGEITGATNYPHITLIRDQRATPIGGSCLASVCPDFNFLD
ncbi:MAG: hypothetical protein OEU91_07735 [Gammaproteobacteria bacterium]|nr:hypothetical protein [Gammaproteobacteria bacterium]